MTITIVGLGPGSPAQLTEGALDALRSGRPVLLRTAIHPTVAALTAMGVKFATCDDLYEREESFEAVYSAIAQRVLRYDDVVYAVPGHPLVGESSVKLILAKAEPRVAIVAGTSFLDTLLVSLRLDPVDGLELLDALQLDQRMPTGDLPAVIMQVHSKAVASDVKLTLMDKYPDDHPVVLVRAAGVPGEEQRADIPLYDLDRQDWVDYLTTLYVPPLAPSKAGDTDPRHWIKPRWSVDPLVEVMARLRQPQGCPWDREQTHQSLRKYLLEEAYEAIEAVDSGDTMHLCEELGDVLLQVAFHAQVASERGDFDMHDVVAGIASKLVRRHPHIFGDAKVSSASDVVLNWEAIKRLEKGATAPPASLLDGVSMGQPALSRATAVQRKAAKVGFDWDDLDGPAEKVREEVGEVLAAGPDEVEGEVGDLLFAAINLGRRAGVDPEIALTKTIGKFMRRFQHIEQRAKEAGKKLAEMTLDEMDCYWAEAKGAEAGQNYGKK